jgi:Flp pilus assembly protein TadD
MSVAFASRIPPTQWFDGGSSMRRFLAAAAIAALVPASALAMGFGDGDGDNMTAKEGYDLGFQKAGMGEYSNAIEILRDVVAKEPTHADAWNMLGFSYRNIGDFDNAWNAYERALTIDPGHKGAHEYIGEWYLMQGDLPSAQAQLEKLEALCPEGCVERDTLAEAIESAIAKS